GTSASRGEVLLSMLALAGACRGRGGSGRRGGSCLRVRRAGRARQCGVGRQVAFGDSIHPSRQRPGHGGGGATSTPSLFAEWTLCPALNTLRLASIYRAESGRSKYQPIRATAPTRSGISPERVFAMRHFGGSVLMKRPPPRCCGSRAGASGLVKNQGRLLHGQRISASEKSTRALSTPPSAPGTQISARRDCARRRWYEAPRAST